MVSRVEYSLTTREKSIAELETSLIYVGTCERQLEKITTLLALTIYSKDSREDREKYFYTAVELAQRCIEDDTIGVPYWREIISTFLHYIRPGMSPEETCSPAFMHLIHDYIQLESNTWIQKRLQHTAHLKESLNNKSTSEKILDTFEAAFGLIRLLIISDDSGEIITQHRIDASEIDTLRDPSKTVLRYTIVRPFDRTRTYCVLIDLGSMESANQIAEHHWKNIIQKIIDIYIERKEIEFCMNQHKIIDAIKFIEEKVEKMKIITSGQNNYRGFIEIVMRVMDPNISHESI